MLKSLEISKKEIKHWIEMIDNFNSYAEEYNLCDPEEINYYIMHLNNWKKIKQDLEVFEILLNHLEFMGEHKTALKLINNGCVSKNGDLYIVKQWLLSNKVGDNHD